VPRIAANTPPTQSGGVHLFNTLQFLTPNP
jgi:hypothetical protein